jgi:hypothetical protein
VRVSYLAPTGSDSSDGATEATAWKTFAFALPRLLPGDALVLLDGTYTQATTGLPGVDCQAAVRSGLADHPIVLAAQHERRAVLASDGSSAGLYVHRCDHWRFEGLAATMTDSSTLGNGGPIVVRGGSDLAFRSVLTSGANRFGSDAAFGVDSVDGVVVEDAEIYRFHVRGLSISKSSGIQVRRTYVNSRGLADLPAGFVSQDPTQGDTGVDIYAARGKDNALDNVVVEGAQRALWPNAGDPGSELRISGSIVLASGIVLTSEGLSVKDAVVVGGDVANWGVFADASGLSLSNVSLVGTGGLYFRSGGTIDNALVFGGSKGISADTPALSLVTASNVSGTQADFQPSEPIDDGAGVFRACLRTPPTGIGTRKGECVAYVPSSSNLSKAGTAGSDIGANIVFRSERGTPTSVKLWRPDGRFPCGDTLQGVNDVPGSSCVNVHERLNFVPGGCPVP